MAHIQKRIDSNGKPKYRVQVRLKGQPIQSATFDRKTDAQKWAQQIESAIREKRYFRTTQSQKHTCGELVKYYLENVLPRKPKSIKTQTVQISWWQEAIGQYSLADITPDVIAQCRAQLSKNKNRYGKPVSSSTVNRYMAALSHLFTIAIDELGWLTQNPLQSVKKLPEEKGRDRFLSDDERTKLLKACKSSSNASLYPIVVLAISTGMRRGEILNLKWADVDLEKGRIFLKDTKNKERRTLPMASKALELMMGLEVSKTNETDLVFPGKNPNSPVVFTKAWHRALEEAGIENFRFHDLRHTAASYMAMNGATLRELADVLGHKTLSMVQRYAHLTEQHTSAIITRMNEKVFGDDQA